MRQLLIGSSRRRALRRNGSVELLESRLLLTAGPRVDGRANIFAAGLSFVPGDGSGMLPPSISIPVGTEYIEFSSITGAVSFDNVTPYTRPFFAPDGGDGLTNIDSLDGISGLISNRHGFLAGVFLESTPPTSNAPDRINVIGDTGFLTTSPSIQQSFFIGDGRTGIGAGYVQKFMVPAGATRLFVGLVDGYDETSATISGPPRYYDDNSGAFAFNYTTYNTEPPLSVTGRANIFGAGLSTPPGEWPGVLPPSIPIPAGANFIEFPSVAGAVSFDNDEPGTRPYFGPDGGTFGPFGAPGLTDINSSGSISGLIHSSHAFLTGVFLTDATPTGVSPNRLNFSASSTFLTIAPELHQTFFVGDGRTGTGNGGLQKFFVPSGATRLFLGFADGQNPLNNTIAGDRNYYHDNGGAIDVQHQAGSIVTGTPGDDVFDVSAEGVFLNGVKFDVTGKVILEGKSGNDSYRFDADSWLGSYSIDESGGGIDTIDFALTTAAVRSALDVVGPQIINQNLTLQLDSSAAIENLVGGQGNDWLSGNSLDNSIKGKTGNDQLFGRSGNDVVAGGPGNDLYEFGSALVAEADRVTELTDQGTDTLSFSSLASPVTLSMSSALTQNVNSLRTLLLNSGSTFENAIGGFGADKLSGNSRGNSLAGGDGDDSLSGLGGNDVLRGGMGDDVYKYFSATAAETETIIEYANEGTDTLDVSMLTEVVTMDLSSTLSQAVSLNRTIKLNSGATMENIISGSGADFLTGNARNNVLKGGQGGDTLEGKTGDDSYVFSPATSFETDILIEAANAGRDSLDFYEINDNIRLNLGTSATQLAHTNRRLRLSSDVAFENVIGGKGNDSLTGNTAFNILVGNAGNDRLSSLGGRDVVIGGLGLDSLLGGDGDDILVAGRTVYDRNIGNLLSIESQWNSGDFYAVRVANLLNGIGTSGVSLKPRNTVLNDSGDDDTGNGGSGTDWYFRALDDVISGLLSSETIGVL